MVRKALSPASLIVLGFLILYGFWGFVGYFQHPGPLSKSCFFLVHEGESLRSISTRLYKGGFVASERLFRWGLVLSGRGKIFKPGDYFIGAYHSPYDIVSLLTSAKSQHKKVTIPEGLTNYQVLQLLKEKEFLKDDNPTLPQEGMLCPETYIFAKGTKISRVLEEMEENMEEILQDLWDKRSKNLPIKSPKEALTLASIVEREAYLDSEKPRIARVYLNRLEKGMPLQADPTIIYCLTEGRGDLGRTLLKKDMTCEGPYNSYKNKGLPPTPIASPSASSLRAVLLNSEATDDLYFVADGKGGHHFSKHYHSHKSNIKKLKRVMKQRSKR